MSSRSRSTRRPARRFLRQAGRTLRAIRDERSALGAFGERMAGCMLEEGMVLPARGAAYWPTEYSSRAGNLMGLGRREERPLEERDAVLFATPFGGAWPETARGAVFRAAEAGASLFLFGDPKGVRWLKGGRRRLAAATGATPPEGEAYGTERIRPLVTPFVLDQLVRTWCATGEAVAACTRAGRMPVIWMSVWLEGARARNLQFQSQSNRGEPSQISPLFHTDYYVPPLAEGGPAGTFLDAAEAMRKTLLAQEERLVEIGRRMAAAREAGGRVRVIATGHSYPRVLALPEEHDLPIEWGGPISHLKRASAELGKGDVLLHFGYAPVDVERVKAILDRGVSLFLTSPYGRPAALPEAKNLLWFDLPWRPGDATVDVPGYAARILPLSSSAHTMAYNAILAEMCERLGLY